MSKERLAVVGNGMAGLRLVEEVERVSPGRFAITVVGAEPSPAYNRVLLSSLLAGEIGAGDVALKDRAWYGAHGIALTTGDPVVRIETEGRALVTGSGARIAYDKLVLATGSDPIRIPVPGSDLPGVEVFRTLHDVASLQAAARASTPAVVIGGGLLGIEAAYGLARAGVDVTLVHLMDRLMERQLDAAGAALLRTALEDKGIKVALNADTAAIEGDGKVERLVLKDGRAIACGLVVMAVGIQPSRQLAAASGLAVKRGIVVDDRMCTSVPGVFALGECAEHRGACYGLVEPAYEQAKVLARVLAGEDAHYEGTVLATNLKVSGVPVFSAGDFLGEGAETLLLRDAGAGSYRKLVIRDERLAGIVMVGETTDALWYLDLVRSQRNISAMRPTVAFGKAYAEAA